ncbi:MAG TPA: 50S ribosomal protein L11 methyltransferase [Tepidisphaeraceae bacterium]|jgi:predicted nicotinamide N-methyase|nr:50S ribosomal protein L11 methyltransferase [Tepidisphaeraceae bacterium]
MPHNEFKLRQRLLHRIGRRYRVVSETVEMGHLRFPFTRIADPDRVLDQVAAEADLRDRLHGSAAPGDELHLPYWAELWESARGIGAYLADGGMEVYRDVGDTRPIVLDLGCGMGLSGTIAAALGATVVFADLEPPALLFARLNSLPWRNRVRTRRLNWQRDKLDQRFNLILGADILYERAQWPFLDAFWREHLAPKGRILLGEPGRQTGEMFVEWITAKGWRLITSEVPVASRPKPIRIFELRGE